MTLSSDLREETLHQDCRRFIHTLSLFALLLWSVPAFCQSGPPPLPPSQLDRWILAGPNWPDKFGDAPLNFASLNTAPGWSRAGTALSVDTNCPAFLNLSVIDDGEANISLPSGTISFWFQPNYTSVADGGDGPTNWASLLTIGQWTSNAAASCWSLVIDPDGTNLIFLAQSNGAEQIVLTAPIDFDAGDWHNVCLTYSQESCCLYLEGQPVTNAGTIAYMPSDSDCAEYGFSIGSEGTTGIFQARGQFLNLETYDGPLWADMIASEYADEAAIILNRGGSLPSSGGFNPDISPPGPPGGGGGIIFPVPLEPEPGYTFTTNYAYYTNFWLTVTNSSTNLLVTLQSTLSNLTYEILTNSSLTTTNWRVWKTLLASNSITSEPPLALASNAMFFRGALVWSTGTNGLPDWWQMNYFGELGVNPNGNPAGDGINNLNKYLMGLNPNIAYVSPLIVLPPGGDFISMPAISVISLAGATIKYTTNGSTPSSTNGISIASGVPLTNLPSGSFTLKAWESGLTSNVPVSATYTIIPATPTFSILGGLHAVGTTLQISCATSNAIVCYTTNGVDPTTNSAQIQATNIITLTTNQTIKALAWLGTNASPVASAAYIIQGALPPPPNDNFSNAITLSGSAGEVIGTTLGATLESFETNSPEGYFDYEWGSDSVWYKWTAPSNGAVFLNYFVYGVGINIYYLPSGSSLNPTNLVPISSSDLSGNDNYSSILTATQNVTYYIAITSYTPGPFNLAWQYVGPSGAPIFSLYPGTYLTPELVTVSSLDPNATMRYTTNGINPTTNNTVIASGASLLIYQTTTLKAAAWRTGLDQSAITTALYTINPASTNPILTASATALSPGNTNFASSLTITLTCTNAGAVIYYTLDGSTPTSASASVSSGGTVTLTNSAPLNASAWVTNMNFSPITTGWYAKNGVDSTGDGIPDTAALAIGADPFVSDANAVNPNPFAHGLDNMQVYQNQSVLLANNYSTLNDGIPDWWLVKNGYSVTTAASALGDNGQTLLTSYLTGLNPNNPNSQPGLLSPIDFHMVHGPSNSMVMVLDTVTTNIVSYILYCTETEIIAPQFYPTYIPQSYTYGQTFEETFPTNTAMPVSGQQWGRYFQLTNQLPPGNWTFTLQGVDANRMLSQISSNTFGRYEPYCDGESEQYSYWARYVGVPVPVVGYTNNNNIKEPILAQQLRALSDTWNSTEATSFAPPTEAVIYDYWVKSLTVEEYWGTLTFQYEPNCNDSYCYPSYSAINYASYFPAICAVQETFCDCGNAYTNTLYNPDGAGPLPTTELTPLQTTFDTNNGNLYFAMPATNTYNPAGLRYLSVTYRIGTNAPVALNPGQSSIIPSTEFTFEAALETETPTFQTINYYFDGRPYPISTEAVLYGSYPPVSMYGEFSVPMDDYVGMADWLVVGISITNPVIIAQVGKPVNLQSCSQVVAVRPNGTQITNQSCWIDQDFAQAYLCDPVTGDVPRTSQPNLNGKMMINTNTAVTTGILSPNLDYPQNQNQYINGFRSADFTPTQTGKVIVTTMPDANGNYGEVTIYVLDMQVDANHDGVMDNRDLTSVNNPMVFWVNNDVDRWHTVDVTDSEQDSLQINDSSLASWQQVPDCQYQNALGQYAIPCTRDLEDYARLWIPGLTNLMHVLRTGDGITLQWRNNTGAGIRIFGAADADGGTNYLFDGTTASNQVDTAWYPCYGYVTSNQPLVISAAAWQQLNGLPPSDNFIFCGTSSGNDELVLQVTNQYGGVLGEASVFLNLQDIKQMYERWSVGEDPTQLPSNIATNCGDQGVASFTYPYDPTLDSTTPYILHVHGSNMKTWEKDRYAETMFKRLYWQGYQGRFGSFRWPTASGFVPVLDSSAVFFSEIEDTAWQSAIGLKNLLTRLNTLYPGQVELSAHSMGNIVVGETLRQAATPLVQTYTAFQGNVPAHAYDPNTPTVSLGSSDVGEPNVYAHYWNATNSQYFSGVVGAASYVNFFNTNDFVLNHWLDYQPAKPVTSLNYNYSSTRGYYTNHYLNDPNPFILTFPAKTYEIFAFCQQAKCNCIGEQPSVGGQFTFRSIPQQVDLRLAPYNFGNEHKYHSGQFRSDNMSRAVFWNQVLVQMGLK